MKCLIFLLKTSLTKISDIPTEKHFTCLGQDFEVSNKPYIAGVDLLQNFWSLLCGVDVFKVILLHFVHKHFYK